MTVSRHMRFGRLIGAAGLVTAAAGPAQLLGGSSMVQAVTAGYSLPLSQEAINNNYGPAGGCCPMNAQTCHHNACNNVGETFWAIDLFQGSGATEFTWAGGFIQYKGNETACGNRVRWGTKNNAAKNNAATSSMYCHGSSFVTGSPVVDQWAASGTPIMKMGSTGTGSGGSVHLHFDHRYLATVSNWGANYNGYCTRLMINNINNNVQPNPTYGYTTAYGILNGNCA